MADSQDYKDTIEKNKKNFADEMKNQWGECKQEV
jgi:hypothetical protein